MVPETPGKSTQEANAEAPKPAEAGAESSEDYELELGEGSVLTIEDLNEIVEFAAEHNLSKEQAEKLIKAREDFYGKGKTDSEKAFTDKVLKMREECQKHEAFATPETAAASFTSINRALSTFGNEELVGALAQPGIGDNIHIALFLKNIGDLLGPAQDTLPSGGQPIGGETKEKSALESWYPSFYEGEKK